MQGAGMTGAETLVWLVVAFADGSDCLLQGSFHRLPEGHTFVREDGCSIRSQQEGSHVVLWSNHRWVAIRIPAGAKSLSYRWGRAVAYINGDSVKVQYGTIAEHLQLGPSMSDQDRMDPPGQWRIDDAVILRKSRPSKTV